MGYLILVDDKRVFEQTNGSFLIPHGTAGDTFASEASVHSLRDMNPLVEVESDGRSPLSFVAEEGVSGYDVVIGSNLPSNYIAALDASCSEAKVPFCSSNCRGVSGFVFSNPQEHEYIIEVRYGDIDTCVHTCVCVWMILRLIVLHIFHSNLVIHTYVFLL